MMHPRRLMAWLTVGCFIDDFGRCTETVATQHESL